MRYSTSAHVVNVLFIGALFLAPVGYCLAHPSIPVEVGRGVIMLSFFLGAIAIADWYGTRFSDSLYGILIAIAFGGIAALVAASVASWKSGIDFADVVFFRAYGAWEGNRILLRTYVVAIGALSLGVVALPRLVFLRLVSGNTFQSR
jgi:hypothetical protein